MITVSILINGQPIYTRSAVNITANGVTDEEKHTYKIDTGKLLTHRRTDGAVKLAIKMLKTIEEKKKYPCAECGILIGGLVKIGKGFYCGLCARAKKAT